MIVLFGSTGFTGKLVTQYFAKYVSRRFPNLEWCIAGRNREKLERLRDSLDTKTLPSIRVGDGTNPTDAKDIVADASVVVSTAGPFLDYSREIVNACLHSGSHYVDITGETPFVRDMLDRGHHDRARSHGIYIVPGCGFDSVPSDIGCYTVVQKIRELTGGGTSRVRCYATLNGKLSGGTVGTFVRMHRLGLADQLSDPFLLGGGDRVAASSVKDFDGVEFCKEANAWTAPFMMAPINTRVVRRTHHLFDLEGKSSYGSHFQYEERALAKNKAHAKALERLNRVSVEAREKMIERGSLPKPGQGPDETTRAQSTFEMKFIGYAEDKKTCVHGVVSGGDPGYDETAKIVSESAVMLATQCNELKECYGVPGGVLTPAFAFRDHYVHRLREVGLVVDIL